ncbi:arsenate reductase ArsC [Nesterenkonia sp. MY13]|uniref:Arsenate reductase ArsC n=2 Tax=Nesterenkonia TaxID=57494 RepID=A0A7X8TJB4_9MICC|nr:MULTISPECIES: arsenate reductase ArsC [Micrococcaceae]NLS09816.1 arsenate reductase ArsC [Nesterenkonia sedimenti]WBL20301.1 arsenate reductase ArsC [Citricoccus sp. NR2]GGE78919.1 low molecular weight phosphatase family protein [Nesterenkonia cremea]
MAADTPPLDTQVLQHTADDLARKYEGIFSPETIERYVFESYTTLSRTARIRDHLAILAERFAADRLRALALAQGTIETTVPQVLFVCVHNVGRSQIASALLAHYAGDRVEVRSAGSLPGSEVHPLVIDALAERHIDLSGAFPKPLTDDVVRAADYVITMGCGDACPIYPGKRYLDWELADPAEETPERIREIVDQIDDRVRALWTEIQN